MSRNITSRTVLIFTSKPCHETSHLGLFLFSPRNHVTKRPKRHSFPPPRLLSPVLQWSSKWTTLYFHLPGCFHLFHSGLQSRPARARFWPWGPKQTVRTSGSEYMDGSQSKTICNTSETSARRLFSLSPRFDFILVYYYALASTFDDPDSVPSDFQ